MSTSAGLRRRPRTASSSPGRAARTSSSAKISPADGHNGIEQLSAQAYQRIGEMIASGAFPPPAPVREVDLVRAFGMSRTPIREALHRLHAEGLISPLRLGGYVAIELGPKEITDIFQVREVLLGLAARLAAQNRTRVDLARLEDVLEAMDNASATQDDNALDEHIRSFYHVLAAASNNTYLEGLTIKVVDLFRYRALAVTHPGWYDRLRRNNRAIVSAIAKQDPDRAETLAREQTAKALATRVRDLQKGRSR